MTPMYRLLFRVFLIFFLTALPATASEPEDYLYVTGPCNLEFPEDHGAHPDYRTEWWYYTGNLKTDNGKRYGFQLTFFRSRINPPGADKKWPSPRSAWRTSQIYMAHAAVSDIDGKKHRYVEDSARSAIGIAGADRTAGSTRIFLKNWSVQIESGRHRLQVSSPGLAFDLIFIPAKPLVLHGDRGYSRKGSTPERATCYYSFTRLEGKGRVTVDGKPADVSGQAWMDHEFSSKLLDPDSVGWDWFSIQLSDQTEIMIAQVRNKDGGLHPASSATFIDTDGQTRHLRNTDFNITVLDTWKSRQSKARYPVSWRITCAPLSLELTLTSPFPDQEMITLATTGVIYWEGSVSVAGTRDRLPIAGHGYVELTGYAAVFDAPI